MGDTKMTANGLKRGAVLFPLVAPVLLGGCVVWQSDYDKVVSQNQQLQQQNSADEQQIAADKAQISRLQGAIKYTVNSDQLFAPGSWEMSAQGKQIIAKMASQLAPTQQNKIVVTGYTDNAPIGPELQRQGIASNQVLSQKRADAVMQYLISQGLNPGLVTARGLGDSNPVASNDTAQGRAKNRRVELTLAGT
jgi:chemotaxis protein MotB